MGVSVVDDPLEETGVVLGRGETHVSKDLRDQVVSVMGRSPQAVQCFVKESEVVGTGVRIAEG